MLYFLRLLFFFKIYFLQVKWVKESSQDIYITTENREL